VSSATPPAHVHLLSRLSGCHAIVGYVIRSVSDLASNITGFRLLSDIHHGLPRLGLSRLPEVEAAGNDPAFLR